MTTIGDCHELAISVFQRTVAAITSITEDEFMGIFRSDEHDGQQTIDPRAKLAEYIWGKLKADGEIGFKDGPSFELVRGYLNAQEHNWYQLTLHDLEQDPLPLRWIIDPAPVDVPQPALPIWPKCPFQLMYRRG